MKDEVRLILWFCGGISLVALAGALFAQLALDMAPCQMCIYQRIPFVVILALSGIGLFVNKAEIPFLGAIGVVFEINAALALYHTGIERQWWSESSGCKANFDFNNISAQSLLDKITSAQISSCSEIPWQDPLLGLSMANYNLLLCLGMSSLCLYGIYRVLKAKHAKD